MFDEQLPVLVDTLQRPLVHYASLSGEQKAIIDPILDKLGGGVIDARG